MIANFRLPHRMENLWQKSWVNRMYSVFFFCIREWKAIQQPCVCRRLCLANWKLLAAQEILSISQGNTLQFTWNIFKLSLCKGTHCNAQENMSISQGNALITMHKFCQYILDIGGSTQVVGAVVFLAVLPAQYPARLQTHWLTYSLFLSEPCEHGVQ